MLDSAGFRFGAPNQECFNHLIGHEAEEHIFPLNAVCSRIRPACRCRCELCKWRKSCKHRPCKHGPCKHWPPQHWSDEHWAKRFMRERCERWGQPLPHGIQDPSSVTNFQLKTPCSLLSNIQAIRRHPPSSFRIPKVLQATAWALAAALLVRLQSRLDP